jgi:hypothetical protein
MTLIAIPRRTRIWRQSGATLMDASGDYLSRTTGLLDGNALYSWMAWWYLVSDLNIAGNMFTLSNGAGSIQERLTTGGDGTTLNLSFLGTNQAGSEAPIGSWFNATVVRESFTSCKLYKNALLDITNTTDVSARGALDGFQRINHSSTARMHARVANPMEWSVALSQDEIRRQMFSLRPIVRLDKLHAWHPGLPFTTDRTKDLSGNKRNWTENGTLSTEPGPLLQEKIKRKRIFFLAGGEAAALAGVAPAQAIAQAQLTTQIPIAGAAILVATAAAPLTTQITSAAQARAQAEAAGALTTVIAPAASAAGITLADGVLTSEIRLTAAEILRALALAGLSTEIPIAGQAVSRIETAAELTVGGGLEAAAPLRALATGELITEIKLDALAIARVLSQAGLLTLIPVIGEAQAGAQAAAELTTEIPAASEARLEAQAAGQFVTEIPLLGEAPTKATTEAALSTAIDVAGSSALATQAGGVLTTIILPQAESAVFAAAEGVLTTSLTFGADGLLEALATGELITQVKLDVASLLKVLAQATLSDVVLLISAERLLKFPKEIRLLQGIAA